MGGEATVEHGRLARTLKRYLRTRFPHLRPPSEHWTDERTTFAWIINGSHLEVDIEEGEPVRWFDLGRMVEFEGFMPPEITQLFEGDG